MKIKIISYGHKFYEEEGKAPPYHDFLFSLRDLKNPFWVPELKDFNGQDQEIIDFFEEDKGTQERLEKVIDLISDFIEDFSKNQHRDENSSLTFAFKCTGGKHRSVYFAEASHKKLSKKLEGSKINVEIEHIDLHRYLSLSP